MTLLYVCFLVVKIFFSYQPLNVENKNGVAEYIFKSINQLEENNTIKLKKQKIVRNSTIIKLYKENDYQPLWNEPKNRADLIDVLEEAYYEGLNPNDYHIDFIKQYNHSEFYRQSDKNKAKADIIMTNAALSFALHMLQGKLQPRALSPSWNYTQRPLPNSIEFRLMYRLNTQTLKEEVRKIRSDLPLYNNLRKWFIKLDSIKNRRIEFNPVLYSDQPLKLGDASPMVGELKRYLGIPLNNTDIAYLNTFDKNLQFYVKEFQTQNGLKADGIVGENTFEMLNTSVDQKMDIVRVNMERCRWLKNEPYEDVMVVNIADFNLYYLKDQKLFYNTKVVVGQLHQQTPVFESAIKYLVLNPTWVVPFSISTKEILPIIQNDITYLDRNEMFLSIKDSIVDYCQIDFNDYTENNFPFVITQEAGLKNPLGLVKFIFPNEHAVYLHDTPAKKFFEETKRTFSHGCVRVEHALDLAELLLEKEGYNRATMDSLLLTKQTHKIYLSQPLTVMLMYWTCYESNGKLFFFKDIYNRDAKILAALNASY